MIVCVLPDFRSDYDPHLEDGNSFNSPIGISQAANLFMLIKLSYVSRRRARRDADCRSSFSDRCWPTMRNATCPWTRPRTFSGRRWIHTSASPFQTSGQVDCHPSVETTVGHDGHTAIQCSSLRCNPHSTSIHTDYNKTPTEIADSPLPWIHSPSSASKYRLARPVSPQF